MLNGPAGAGLAAVEEATATTRAAMATVEMFVMGPSSGAGVDCRHPNLEPHLDPAISGDRRAGALEAWIGGRAVGDPRSADTGRIAQHPEGGVAGVECIFDAGEEGDAACEGEVRVQVYQ